MKHTLKIILILLSMFIITQFIGLLVINSEPLKLNVVNSNGTVEQIPNPYLSWINSPQAETQTDSVKFFTQIIIAFVFAIVILFFLMRFKLEYFIRGWFFLVVVVALFISFLAFEKMVPFQISLKVALIFALSFAFIFSYLKLYKKNLIVHNLTELLIYPGIAVVFVPLLNTFFVLFLLVLISLYDAWAVWKSGIMQKMAKYQMNKLNIFSGFLVPYISSKTKAKIENIKKLKSKKKIKISVAILGGGDVVFPIITAGVIMKAFGLIPAFFVILGATCGLSYLLFFARKEKFYPAMPFITAGIMLSLGFYWAISFF